MAYGRFGILCLLLSCLSAHGDSIVLAADFWCPINCEPGSAQEGYMIKIARNVFEQEGHLVEYRVIPWSRAIQMAREGKVDGVVGPYVEDCPDFVFPENELGMIGFSFFVTAENSWRFRDLSSLHSMKLAVAANYSYGEQLDQYIYENKTNRDRIQVNYGNTPVKNNLRMLLSNRVDLVVSTEPVFWHLAKQLSATNRLKKVGVATSPQKSYIAFSPELPTSGKYATILSDGVDRLRRSGELDEILAEYGLKDWRERVDE